MSDSDDEFAMGDECEECGRLMWPDEDDGFGVCPDCCADCWLDNDQD